MGAERPSQRSFARQLLRWGRRHRRTFPWREDHDPFRTLVAEVLLRRSRAGTVAGVYQDLFERWPSAGELAEAPVEEVAEVIRPAGLTGRAASIVRIARRFSEGPPPPPDRYEDLPGVGRYAARATVASALDRRAPVVDAVSARVYRRYFGLTDDVGSHRTVDDELWALVDEVTPRTAAREWNWAVLDLAAEVCLPRRPRCKVCPLEDRCAHRNAT